MAWINPRQIFYFFLLTVCSQTGQCCKKMFAKPMYEAIVPPQLLKGNVVLKVIFYHCNFGDHIKLHTNDANFGIHSDGTVYATRPLLIKSEYYFQVRAKDLRTHEKWKVPIQLMPFANQSKTVLKNEHPKIYFRKADHFRRQKREWIIPPLDVREHEPPSYNPIGSIVSDIQFDVLTYTISGPGADRPPVGLFVIDHRTGDLNITGEVDREKTPQFRLIGQAWNSHNQPVENPLELVIKVQDINDNRPEFTKEVFEGSVEELSRFGTFVLQLNATDKDEGENAQIFYRILHQGGKEMFVSNSNGEIKTLATDLDRETQDLYTLLVEARDLNGRAEGLYATANVQIRILDVNDNIPTTEKEEYEVSVQENTLNDDVIRIKVIDKDQEFTDNWLGNIEIIEGNEDGNFRFEMDEQTNEGILILQKELDYEESSARNLVLKVSNKAAYHASVLSGGGGGLGGGGGPIRDGGLKPIKLKVNVKDQKEGFSFKPTKKRIGVGENKKKVHVGQKLGKYPAISVDTGKESEGVRYAKGLDPANLFNINPDTSEITLAKVPDREAEYIVDGKYTATVLAISNDGPTPKTSTGTVVIEVEDENDNIPIIENLQPCMCDRAKSLIITAEDLDSYPNGAPFTFKFDDVPEVAEKWKILRRDDTSVELQPRHELWPGVFTVPLKVEDNQGSGKVQDVEVHVVECTNNSPSCSERAKPIRGSNARLGAAAIGLMAFGALLLLLAPLLLLFCNSSLGGIGGAGGFKPIPIETFGTVEHKNIEGGGERDTHMPLLPVSAATAAAVGTYPSEMDSRKGGAGVMEQNLLPLNMNSSDVLYTNYIGNSAMQEGVNVQGDAHCLSYMESNMNMGVMENGRIRTMSEGALLDFMDSYIDEKVDMHNLEDQTSPGHDTLLIYNYEGDGSLAGSIDSCNFIEGGFETGDSYLDNLDLKFKTLADICTGKLESQEITVSVDAPVHQEIVKKERSVSSSSVGLQAMNIIPDSTLMRKNYVVTTTINPVVDMVPLAASQAFDHQNIVVTNQVNTVPRRINIIENPNIAHQNIVMTKMVNGGAEVIPDMIIDPSVAHQSVIVTEQFRNSCRGNPAMIFNPSVTHHNAVVTNVIEGGAGDMQGMIAQPHTVENVMVTKSIHKGDSQSTLSDSSLDHIPTIHKNVTLKKSAKSAMEGVQSSTVPNEAMVQKTRVSRRSVTSSDNNVHSSVTKVTKVAQVMQ